VRPSQQTRRTVLTRGRKVLLSHETFWAAESGKRGGPPGLVVLLRTLFLPRFCASIPPTTDLLLRQVTLRTPSDVKLPQLKNHELHFDTWTCEAALSGGRTSTKTRSNGVEATGNARALWGSYRNSLAFPTVTLQRLSVPSRSQYLRWIPCLVVFVLVLQCDGGSPRAIAIAPSVSPTASVLWGAGRAANECHFGFLNAEPEGERL
jgi:hypothetical protein